MNPARIYENGCVTLPLLINVLCILYNSFLQNLYTTLILHPGNCNMWAWIIVIYHVLSKLTSIISDLTKVNLAPVG